MKQMIVVFWFRRDLRLTDNAGLWHALRSGYPVLPLFIFDANILESLKDKSDRRVNFIYTQICRLHARLRMTNASLMVKYGDPVIIFDELASEFNIVKVIANHDYDPYGRERDTKVSNMLQQKGIHFHTFKDQVLFEKDEVLKEDGLPYTVFTPYMRKWKAIFKNTGINTFSSDSLLSNVYNKDSFRLPALAEIGFSEQKFEYPSAVPDQEIIRNYHLTRNSPAISGTTRLGVHLRFGTISIRELITLADKLNEVFLNELIWREFFMMILWHFPHVTTASFRSKFDRIEWRNNETEFQAWCTGSTGYPLVDAGMRELNATGFMHNRVRMVTAGFLTKHLLIDWRWGEAWFAEKLLDYELSSNNGGWQWAAGTGCDAVPYFRIFNPELQQKKFDPDKAYVRRWVPEYDGSTYSTKIVGHVFARKRALDVLKSSLA